MLNARAARSGRIKPGVRHARVQTKNPGRVAGVFEELALQKPRRRHAGILASDSSGSRNT
jgi:hypothetical protein